MDIGVFSAMPSAEADTAIIAKRAEELGFESYWVPDHPILLWAVRRSIRAPLLARAARYF